jgi:polysaccharide biosynthesis protein PslH
MREELARLLTEHSFDIVQIEGVHLSSYLPLIRRLRGNIPVLCDWHNIESELMRRYAEASRAMFHRMYAQRTAQLLENAETGLLRTCNGHNVCSERERSALLARCPDAKIQVIGNGVDVRYFSEAGGDTPGQRRDIVFVGSMDYHANIDAATYFAREIWPMLRERAPDLRFVIVGSRPTPEVVALGQQPGIHVTGTVPDIRPYYRNAMAVAVPLRVGSGTRLKVLEAMAAGVPVISTPLGAEGLEATPDKNFLVARRAEDFVSGVQRLAADPGLWASLAQSGREFVTQRYDWGSLGESLWSFYQQIVR